MRCCPSAWPSSAQRRRLGARGLRSLRLRAGSCSRSCSHSSKRRCSSRMPNVRIARIFGWTNTGRFSFTGGPTLLRTARTALHPNQSRPSAAVACQDALSCHALPSSLSRTASERVALRTFALSAACGKSTRVCIALWQCCEGVLPCTCLVLPTVVPFPYSYRHVPRRWTRCCCIQYTDVYSVDSMSTV